MGKIILTNRKKSFYALVCPSERSIEILAVFPIERSVATVSHLGNEQINLQHSIQFKNKELFYGYG